MPQAKGGRGAKKEAGICRPPVRSVPAQSSFRLRRFAGRAAPIIRAIPANAIQPKGRTVVRTPVGAAGS